MTLRLFHLLWTSFVMAAGLTSNLGADPIQNFDSVSSGIKHEIMASTPFYDPASVQSIYLTIKREDLEKLHKALPERIKVQGMFRWKDQATLNATIRYKGNSSSMPHAQHKRSFLITFQDEEFLGLKQVALDNGIQFGSLFSEPLITGILRDVGVKSSRCNYARVYLNGDYMGIYVNVERVDSAFLRRNFGDDQGLLFKVDEGGPGGDLRFLGDDRTLYQKTFELHLGKKAEAYGKLLAFIQLANSTNLSENRLRDTFDIDSFISTSAVLLLAGAFDQYTGWNPHNYFLYKDSRNRWTYIPWDLDVGFADNAFGQIPVLKGWNAAWLTPVTDRPLMEQIIAKTNLLDNYRVRTSQILETHFKPEILISKLHKLYNQIKADLEKDPFPHRRATVPVDMGYDHIVSSMESFIQQRYTLARAQLDRPGARPQPKPLAPPNDQEGPRPGPPSADAPTDLKVVRVTSSSVELGWVDRANGEVAFVVQKSLGAEPTTFVNAIGQGGSNITSAIDKDVQPGKVYWYRVYAVHPTPSGPRGTGVSNIISVEIPRE